MGAVRCGGGSDGCGRLSGWGCRGLVPADGGWLRGWSGPRAGQPSDRSPKDPRLPVVCPFHKRQWGAKRGPSIGCRRASCLSRQSPRETARPLDGRWMPTGWPLESFHPPSDGLWRRAKPARARGPGSWQREPSGAARGRGNNTGLCCSGKSYVGCMHRQMDGAHHPRRGRRCACLSSLLWRSHPPANWCPSWTGGENTNMDHPRKRLWRAQGIKLPSHPGRPQPCGRRL